MFIGESLATQAAMVVFVEEGVAAVGVGKGGFSRSLVVTVIVKTR